MRRAGFTEGAVRGFKPPATGYQLHWDAKTPGLGLRVTANGARSYVFERRVNGSTARTTIGDQSVWNLADARMRARELGVLVDKGSDPRIVAAEERAKAEARRVENSRRDLTVEGAWQVYVEANGHKWGERHRDAHVSLAHRGGEKFKRGKGVTKPAPLASLMPLKLSELTSETVEAWLKQESKKRPTSAAGAYRLLRAFCTWTHGKPQKDKPDYRSIVAADACSAREVSDALPVSKPKGDKLKRGDLPAWFSAVRGLQSPTIGAYLQCLLLTGARREEMAGLRWKDVSISAKPQDSSLTLRDKVDGVREISLPPYVASLIAALPRKNQWVFHSDTSASGRLIEPRKLHNSALKSAGIAHVSLHGLRRTFATMPDYLDDMPAGVIAQIMGHKPSATAEKHYKVRQIDQLHIWHAKLETWILAEAGVVFTPPAAKGRLGVVALNGAVRPAAAA